MSPKTSDNPGMPAFALGNEPVDLLHVLENMGQGTMDRSFFVTIPFLGTQCLNMFETYFGQEMLHLGTSPTPLKKRGPK